MEVRGQLHALTILLLGKNLYPLNKRLGGPLTKPGYLEKKKIALPMLGFKLPDCVAHSLVATQTVLP